MDDPWLGRLLPELSIHDNCEQIGNMLLCSDVFSPEPQLRRRTCRMTNRCYRVATPCDAWLMAGPEPNDTALA
jgi:hypothetical protein